mgnify:CR=1 FL=1
MEHKNSKRDSLIARVRDYGVAGLLYLASHAADSLATAYNAKTYGNHGELNPIPRFFMNKFGPERGLLIKGTMEAGIVLYLTYKSRRIYEYMPSESFLYLFSLAHFFSAASNIPDMYSDDYSTK